MARLQDLLCAELKRQLGNQGRGASMIPAGGELLWRWFLDLNRTRTYHMGGANPISHAEIEAYARSMRQPLRPDHIAVLCAMDEVWLDHARRQNGKAAQGEQSRFAVSPQKLTGELFAAMFG